MVFTRMEQGNKSSSAKVVEVSISTHCLTWLSRQDRDDIIVMLAIFATILVRAAEYMTRETQETSYHFSPL